MRQRLFDDDGVPVVGVPKTIDNDIGGTEMTFGFDTAVAHRDRRDRPTAHHRRIARPGDGRRGHGSPRRPHRHLGGHRRRRHDHPHPRGALRHRRGLRRRSKRRHERAGSPRSSSSPRVRRPPRARSTDPRTRDRRATVTSVLGGIGSIVAREIEAAHRLRDPGHRARPRAARRNAHGVRPGAVAPGTASRPIEAAHDGDFGTMVALQNGEGRASPAGRGRRSSSRPSNRELWDVAKTFFA